MKKSILLGVVFLVCYSFGYSQCMSNITISGPYTTTLTQSADWIVSSGTTTITPSSNVTLNAGDYIQLNPDFEANSTSIFLAQIIGCTLGINQNTPNSFVVFPNPTNNIVTVKSTNGIQNIALYDMNGRILQNIISDNNNEQSIDLSNLPSGIYMMEIKTDFGKSVEKIVKN